jgi:hypothetical protein
VLISYRLPSQLFLPSWVSFSSSLAGQAVGVKEVEDGIWLVSFMNYDLGYIDIGGENPAAS